MTFHSILFEKTENSMREETHEAPFFFVDLNLDQIINAVTAGKKEYDLTPFFYASLTDIDAIKYRHEIMRDLENATLLGRIESFAGKMRAMREHLAQVDKLSYAYQKQRWFLDAVEIYCDSVTSLAHDLSSVEAQSRGFMALREYLANYVSSDRFTSLLAEAKRIKADLSTVKYLLLIRANAIEVRRYVSETDYGAEVEKTFARFKQEAAKDYRVEFSPSPHMNHVEAQILDLVAKMHPQVFSDLGDYCAKNGSYLDETIAAFDREIQFYIAYLEYIAAIKRVGLPFCYPQISDACKEIYDYEGFDLALAHKLIREHSSVVCNDFYLRGKERMFVVTGPNQGGKTTFARAFGQLHYLASIGLPVPGREAQLFVFDRLFTHFEKEENIGDLRGKLEDDLVRIKHILDEATSNSIVIMNEILTSTTFTDALFLSKEIMGRIVQLDLLSVWVTFLDELASFSEKTVSMVSTVVPENPTLRTYKIVRRPADGRAYAISLAEKYQLTHERLRDRIRS